MTVLEQPEQFAENSSCIALIVPGLGRMSLPPTISTFAAPPESLIIHAAAALPASLNGGAVTVAVTSAQPSQLGTAGISLSWKCITITGGMPAALAACSCGPSARGGRAHR